MYIRNLAQLILSPSRAWQEIASQDAAPSLLMRNGFYRLMSLVAITAFVRGLYTAGSFDVALALQKAMVQFIALFAGLAIARATLDSFVPQMTELPDTRRRIDTLAIYGISLIAMMQAIVNLCPVEHMLLAMLPAFVLIVVFQSRNYLDIADNNTVMYLVLTNITIVLIPVALIYLLGMII